jgi:hypothetical protein
MDYKMLILTNIPLRFLHLQPKMHGYADTDTSMLTLICHFPQNADTGIWQYI